MVLKILCQSKINITIAFEHAKLSCETYHLLFYSSCNCHILFIPGMIKLGSENFPVTYLKSINYLNLVSCVNQKLWSLSHLSMLTSYKFRTLVAFWAPFDLYSALKKLNTCIILLNAWQHRISHKTLSARANL